MEIETKEPDFTMKALRKDIREMERETRKVPKKMQNMTQWNIGSEIFKSTSLETNEHDQLAEVVKRVQKLENENLIMKYQIEALTFHNKSNKELLEKYVKAGELDLIGKYISHEPSLFTKEIMDIACSTKKLEIVEYIYEHTHISCSVDSLLDAIYDSAIDIVNYIEINMPNIVKEVMSTPIDHHICNLQMIKFMFLRGAIITEYTLYRALDGGHYDVLKFLLEITKEFITLDVIIKRFIEEERIYRYSSEAGKFKVVKFINDNKELIRCKVRNSDILIDVTFLIELLTKYSKCIIENARYMYNICYADEFCSTIEKINRCVFIEHRYSVEMIFDHDMLQDVFKQIIFKELEFKMTDTKLVIDFYNNLCRYAKEYAEIDFERYADKDIAQKAKNNNPFISCLKYAYKIYKESIDDKYKNALETIINKSKELDINLDAI